MGERERNVEHTLSTMRETSNSCRSVAMVGLMSVPPPCRQKSARCLHPHRLSIKLTSPQARRTTTTTQIRSISVHFPTKNTSHPLFSQSSEANSPYERLYLLQIFSGPLCVFHSPAHVHGPWPDPGNCLPPVFWRQSACQDNRHSPSESSR